MMREFLDTVYQRLFSAFGAQHWWPASSEFEMMVGAILTQNTAWSNVEMALQRFKQPITPDRVLAMPLEILEEAVRPCGYFRQKALRLHALAAWCRENGCCALDFTQIKTERLREILLSLHGVGPETADSILLYALERPVFVVDAYTRRMLSRLFNDESYSTMSYDAVATLFHECVPPELTLYNEYHALIVRLCKEYCIKRAPRCTQCPLADLCASVDISAQM